MGELQSSISMTSRGVILTITDTPSYVCGNYDSNRYYAQNSFTGEYELISTDAVQVITYAVNNLTPERTGPETVLLIGNFSIDRTITLNDGNVLLDCSHAQLSLEAYTILLEVREDNTIILGGHWVGPSSGTAQAIQFMYAQNCILKDANIEGFPSYYGAVSVGLNSGGITIENCWIHDNDAGTPCINIGDTYGYHQIIDCRLGNSGMGIMVGGDGIHHNQILGCEFYGWQTGSGTQCHGIYLSGHAGSNEGHNIVSGCSFHDPHDGAGILIKSQNNQIYDNDFYNFPDYASVGLSTYSQYSPCTANDNEIYDNTFTDMYYAIWVGQDSSFTQSPTLRNRYHDNLFTNVDVCFDFLSDGASSWTNDTAIYYNTFAQCTTAIDCDSNPYTANTVIAYNDFGGATVTQRVLTSCSNTMVYGNTGLADFNVPSPLPIPPP